MSSRSQYTTEALRMARFRKEASASSELAEAGGRVLDSLSVGAARVGEGLSQAGEGVYRGAKSVAGGDPLGAALLIGSTGLTAGISTPSIAHEAHNTFNTLRNPALAAQATFGRN